MSKQIEGKSRPAKRELLERMRLAAHRAVAKARARVEARREAGPWPGIGDPKAVRAVSETKP